MDNQTINQTELQAFDVVNDLRPLYSDLFRQKLVEGDKQLIDILIENRQKMANRFNITIIVEAEGITGPAGEVKIQGVLPEDLEQAFAEIYEGAEVEYLGATLQQIENIYQRHGAGAKTHSKTYDTRKNIKISKVNMKIDFA